MPSTTPINLNFGSFFSLNFDPPNEGPRSTPIQLDFTKTVQYNITLQNTQAQNYLSKVSSVFIDNSANSQSTSLTFQPSGQVIKIASGMQGYFTVIAPSPVSISFLSWGNVQNVEVSLLNFSIPPCMWNSQELIANRMAYGTSFGLNYTAIITGNYSYFIEGIWIQLSSDAVLSGTGGIAVTANGGAGYTNGGFYTVTGGSGMELIVTSAGGVVSSAVVAVPGTGYHVGDSGFINGGNGVATYSVTAIQNFISVSLQDSGVPTTFWYGVISPGQVIQQDFLWTAPVAGTSLNLIVGAGLSLRPGQINFNIPYGLCSFLGT